VWFNFTANRYKLRFRILLTDGAKEVRFGRVAAG
jgi:hypothetical protein